MWETAQTSLWKKIFWKVIDDYIMPSILNPLPQSRTAHSQIHGISFKSLSTWYLVVKRESQLDPHSGQVRLVLLHSHSNFTMGGFWHFYFDAVTLMQHHWQILSKSKFTVLYYQVLLVTHFSNSCPTLKPSPDHTAFFTF